MTPTEQSWAKEKIKLELHTTFLYLNRYLKASKWSGQEFWLDFSICIVFQRICLLGLKLFKETLEFFLSRCSIERRRALTLVLVICTVHLVICLDRWARKCSNVISNIISSTKFIWSSIAYSDRFQTSTMEPFCINSERLNAVNYFCKKAESYIFKKVLNILS